MHESAMDDNESFEALEAQNCELGKELDEEDDDDDDDEEEEEEEEEERFGEVQSLVAPIEAEFTKSQPETLAVSSSIPFSETDRHVNLATSSSQQLLTGGADERTMTRVIDLEGMGAVNSLVSGEFKEQVGALHEEVFAGVTVQAAVPQRKNQLGCSQCPTSSSELSPTSVTQSTLSDPSPTTFERRLSPIPKANNGCLPETEHQNSFDLKAISAVHIVKTPSADGYNWRKYGQKLVKSTKGSRSYYKCTYAECCSKKIKCSDHSGGVIEIIYKGPHNHEPPRKVNSTKESKLAASAGSDLGNSHIAHPVKSRNLLYPSSSSREPIQETSPLPEPKRQKSRDSDGNVEVEVKVKDEQVAEPEPKQRLKKSGPAHPGPLKPGKKPKLVLHAAGDVGISSDGYRWRKYGQKMVKGNPHPRNYYRCTSAGCPVRKHIERATENTSTLIITYKGVHDHDMPVPKKRHGPPSAHLVAAAAPASMSNLQLKSCDALKNQTSSTQWSLDTEGELTGEALDVGSEKVIESARTLLSIGFEIKPC